MPPCPSMHALSVSPCVLRNVMPRSPSIVVLVQFDGLLHLKTGQWPTAPTFCGCNFLFGDDACSNNEPARAARPAFGGVQRCTGCSWAASWAAAKAVTSDAMLSRAMRRYCRRVRFGTSVCTPAGAVVAAVYGPSTAFAWPSFAEVWGQSDECSLMQNVTYVTCI